MIRDVPNQQIIAFYTSPTDTPLEVATKQAIDERLHDPLIQDAPDFSSPDGYGELALELYNWSHPEQQIEALPPGPVERLSHTIQEWASGRQTLDSALRRNFEEFYRMQEWLRTTPTPTATPHTSPTPIPMRQTGGGEGRDNWGPDPNNGIGVHARDEMEAGLRESQAYAHETGSFAERLHEPPSHSGESNGGGRGPASNPDHEPHENNTHN